MFARNDLVDEFRRAFLGAAAIDGASLPAVKGLASFFESGQPVLVENIIGELLAAGVFEILFLDQLLNPPPITIGPQ